MRTGVTIGSTIPGIADTVGDGITGRVGLGVGIAVFAYRGTSLILIRALRTGSTRQAITNVPRLTKAVCGGCVAGGAGVGILMTAFTIGDVGCGIVCALLTCNTRK